MDWAGGTAFPRPAVPLLPEWDLRAVEAQAYAPVGDRQPVPSRNRRRWINMARSWIVPSTSRAGRSSRPFIQNHLAARGTAPAVAVRPDQGERTAMTNGDSSDSPDSHQWNIRPQPLEPIAVP